MLVKNVHHLIGEDLVTFGLRSGRNHHVFTHLGVSTTGLHHFCSFLVTLAANNAVQHVGDPSAC